MRIIKRPDVRKQEILESAVRVFAEKGYENTSIADIAKAAGISQGLCYRYFPAKEALYDDAIDAYASRIVDSWLKRARPTALRDQIACFAGRFDWLAEAEGEDAALFALFHQNRKLHDALALRVAQALVPHVARRLQDAAQRGEIAACDEHLLAHLLVFGQLGMFLSGKSYPPQRIQSCLLNLLNPSKEDA